MLNAQVDLSSASLNMQARLIHIVFKRFTRIPFWIYMLLIGLIQTEGTEDPKGLKAISINELEIKLTEMEDERELLARLTLRTGSGTIGYRSKWRESSSPFQEEWVEIDLGEVSEIDQIVLVPTLWRSEDTGFHADAFPEKFRIIAGTPENHPKGTVIAEYESRNAPQIGIAPVILPIKPIINASWIRLEASELSVRRFDEQYVLQLAEMFVFSGNKNVALKKPVYHESNDSKVRAWEAQNLTDGFTPYIMDAGYGINSVAYLSHRQINPIFSIDLGKPYPISQIHLHTVEQSDTVPQAFNTGLGIPQHLRIEGSQQADFSDTVSLIDDPQIRTQPSGPIMMWDLTPKEFRYIRIYDPSQADNLDAIDRLGFAEIELFSGSKNVALGASVSANYTPTVPYRKLESLTDGHNLYGAILPTRQWLEELSRQQVLLYDIPKVQSELTNRYLKQKANLIKMSWLIVGLIITAVMFFLISHNLQLRQFNLLKKRIAADLHDELGANIHTIGLLSDAAQTAHDSPDQLNMLHTRIRNITESTGRAIEHSTNMLESTDMHVELLEGFRTISRRFSSQVAYDLTVTGEDYLNKLKPHVCMDLLLFYKECLVNITRHSHASEMTAELLGERKQFKLIVTDNGSGIKDSDSNAPKSLKRRAGLMNAQLKYKDLPEGGTRITLIYRTKKLGYI